MNKIISSYKTISASRDKVNPNWLIVDADGAFLGRLASRVAYLLKGKHKTNYTPHVNCGDIVIILNSDKIRLSGKKWDDKEYVSHTGYPGGQRFTTPRKLMEKTSRLVVEKAVKRMLPKNIIGREMFRRLHVFEGTDHKFSEVQASEIKLQY